MSREPTTAPRRKSETRQRTKLTQIRLTPDEAAEIERRRMVAGFQSVADMIRVRCLGKRPLRARLDLVAWLKVQSAVNRIGGNVNQIAARANSRGSATVEQLAAVRTALEALYGLVEQLDPERQRQGIPEGGKPAGQKKNGAGEATT